MRDTTGKNRHDSLEEPEESSDRPAVSYSPRQRRTYLEGLRAWARVAVRSYANRSRAPANSQVTPDDGGRTGEESTH